MNKNDIRAVSILGLVVAVSSMIVLSGLVYWHKNLLLLIIIIPILANSAVAIIFLLAKKYPPLFDIARFLAVGSSTFFVDAGIYNLLVLLTQTGQDGIWFTIFKSVSFICAALYSFYWYKTWAFKHKENKNISTEILQFFTVSISGLIINGIASTGFVFLREILYLNISAIIWANIGIAIGSIAAMFCNFFGYKLIVFRRK